MNFNEKLIMLRKNKNLSQEQLGNELNVARQTVSKWELGETLPDVENLKKMAILFEFSIDEALGLEVEKDDDSDNDDWLMVGGFCIGIALGVYFDNMLLGFVCGMIGLGLSLIIKAFKKK